MPKLRLRPNPSLAAGLWCAALLFGATGCGPGGGGSLTTFAITFSLSAAPSPLDSLSFDVAYRGGGDFDGQGTAVECRRMSGAVGATSTFEDDDIQTLAVDLTAGDTAMEAVREIVRCLFSAEAQPTTGNFTVTITEALDEDGNDVKTQTQVLVTSIVEDSGNTSTDHFITFGVTSTHAAVGALQFDVDFLGDTGAFAVSGDKADCTNLTANSVLATSVIDGQLTAGLISLSGFSAPTNVIRCLFISATAPVADDFDVTVTEARTVDGDPLYPDVSVSSITTGTAQ